MLLFISCDWCIASFKFQDYTVIYNYGKGGCGKGDRHDSGGEYII